MFTDCAFDEQPLLNDAVAEFVGFNRCQLPGLSAARLRCRGPLWIINSEFSQSVILSDSHIMDIDAHNLSLNPPRGRRASLNISGSRVEHDINISEAEINGAIVAVGAHIKGSLMFAETTVTSNDSAGLFAKLIKVGGNVTGSNAKFIGMAGIDLEGAEINGAVALVEASIKSDKGYALNLDHAEIKLGVHASDIDVKGAFRYTMPQFLVRFRCRVAELKWPNRPSTLFVLIMQ